MGGGFGPGGGPGGFGMLTDLPPSLLPVKGCGRSPYRQIGVQPRERPLLPSIEIRRKLMLGTYANHTMRTPVVASGSRDIEA